MPLLSCFAGFLGPPKGSPARAGGGQSPGSWTDLPGPVSDEVLSQWLPVSYLQEETAVIFIHLGRFDLASLERSGCTRRDLLLICEEKLSRLEQQVKKLSVVVDLHHVRLDQLNSQWWKVLAPRLLELLEQRFPQLLRELIFLRAQRLSGLAARRLLGSRPGTVLEGSELQATELLERHGLAFAADCFFRDPNLWAVAEARRRRQGRRLRRRLCRQALLGLLLALVLLLFEVVGVPISSFSMDYDPSKLGVLGLVLFLTATWWMWRPLEQAVEEAFREHAHVFVLLLGSPVCWAAAFAGQLPWWLSGLGPGLAVLLCCLVLERPKEEAKQVKGAWWPKVVLGASGEPCFAVDPGLRPRRLPPLQGDGKQLLSRLMSLSGACRQVSLGGKRLVGDLLIQCIVAEEGRAVWSAQRADDPVMFVASEVALRTSAPLEAVLWALYAPEERLKWDGKAFKAYEVLGQEVQAKSRSSCDFLYCRVPMPGVKDRDMVQERFLMRLEDEPGYALAIQSCSACQCSLLERQECPEVVRARTILSGYVLRPGLKGVLLTAVSQTDLGGSVPQWLQGMVKKAGKRMPLQWADRLEAYCNSHGNGVT